MSVNRKDILRHRSALYFDCIVGSGIAILSLTLIFTGTRYTHITDIASFFLSVGFWIFFLGLAVFLIAVGLRGLYLEKKYPDGVPTKKEIRAPMVG
jgi:hypothetical protein